MAFDMEFLVEPDDLPDDYEPQDEGYPECFRVGGEGMALLLTLMTRADVIDSSLPTPEFPQWPPPGLDDVLASELARYWDEPAEVDKRLGPAEVPVVEAYRRARNETGATPSPQPGKVPAFKFESNDGWIVTPDECRVIAAGMDRLLSSDLEVFLHLLKADGWNPEGVTELMWLWTDYNRIAAQFGGYRVF